jgi:hypothetical protein
MYDLHTFAGKLVDLGPSEVEPTWQLVGLMYRLLQIQHRAIGYTLDRLQKHDPATGFTFAATHGMTQQVIILREAYAAVSTTDPDLAAAAKSQLDEITPDPDQFTPEQWFNAEVLEAARLAGFAPKDVVA